MKVQSSILPISRGKIISIGILYAASIAIVLSGATFSIYSFINNVQLRVLSAMIPGYVFGITVAFLGVRYFISVRKLQVELFKKSSKFSWNNFKKEKS